MSEASVHNGGVLEAFAEYERRLTIENYRVACILGIVFMPAGVALDFFVYPRETWTFFKLRLLCSALLALVWSALRTRPGIRFYRLLGLIEVSLPLLTISWMIHVEEGPASPYYAGLNLVLMGAGIVLRWGLQDSILVLLAAMGMYIGACQVYHPWRDFQSVFFNNLYFLFVTGVFTITGNYFYSRIRFSEFQLRFQLDQNRALLEQSNRKLKELDEVKSRFFANISHELRTPLTLLLAPLESLQSLSTLQADPQLSETLATMRANGMRLLKLINDLLDLVRLESGKMPVKREPVDMETFARGLLQAVNSMAQDKRVALTGAIQPNLGMVLADRDKLEKVILNLLFNAVKFTPAGGRIVLRIARNDGTLRVDVEDTGMGIDPKNLPYVFDRFWQADTSSQRKYQGAGIGLALVKELVEVQGGTVSVQSELQKGTNMSVSLPAPEAPAAAPATEQMPQPPAGEKQDTQNDWLVNLYRRAEFFPSVTSLEATIRPPDIGRRGPQPLILIADDEPDMLRFLRTQLESQFQVMEAVDGNQAIEKASQYLPDLILLDMMMPEKDGLAVCRELRAKSSTQNIPIVLLTARADDETKLAALDGGASDFLAKPFSTTELHVRLRNLVQSHRLQITLARQNQILESTLEQLKDTETQLVQSEKLASLGRMSAGIIHEINNPLNYAKTGLYSLRNKGKLMAEEERGEYSEILADVEEGIDRVRRIVTDLRTFTHPNTERFDMVSLRSAVEPAMRFLSGEIKDKITVQLDVAEEHRVWGNDHQLTQVILNLLQNAADALRRKRFVEEAPLIQVRSFQDEFSTRLVIRDNGEGISPKHTGKIFDPFFTTKDVGEGMGLGLSICYKIIQQHRGRIHVQSEPGKFAEFTLEFPRQREMIAEEVDPGVVAGERG